MTAEIKNGTSREARHNRAAPYWAVAFVVTLVIGVSTTVLDFGAFWRGYVLDITGPAWNYILVRRLSHPYADNAWTRLFTPWRTFALFILFAFGIELAQYLKLYESTYDPWDFLAYISLLVPMFLLDIRNR